MASVPYGRLPGLAAPLAPGIAGGEPRVRAGTALLLLRGLLLEAPARVLPGVEVLHLHGRRLLPAHHLSTSSHLDPPCSLSAGFRTPMRRAWASPYLSFRFSRPPLGSFLAARSFTFTALVGFLGAVLLRSAIAHLRARPGHRLLSLTPSARGPGASGAEQSPSTLDVVLGDEVVEPDRLVLSSPRLAILRPSSRRLRRLALHAMGEEQVPCQRSDRVHRRGSGSRACEPGASPNPAGPGVSRHDRIQQPARGAFAVTAGAPSRPTSLRGRDGLDMDPSASFRGQAGSSAASSQTARSYLRPDFRRWRLRAAREMPSSLAVSRWLPPARS